MITDQAAIKFSNEQVRRCADQMGRFYYLAKQMVDTWNANSYSVIFPNDDTLVADGATQDGRKPVTGAHVNEMVFAATQFVASFEQGSNAILNNVLQVSVNPN